LTSSFFLSASTLINGSCDGCSCSSLSSPDLPEGPPSLTLWSLLSSIPTGKIEGNQSIIQWATTAAASPNTATEDDNNISRDKVVGSGTSFDEDKSIDKADIYSTEEDGTRHLERAQEKPVEKVEDKEKGSWRIKERREEE
jgi:hypothetical protein